MAYSTSNRPYLTVPTVGGGFGVGSTDVGGAVWAYRSSDPLATVATTGYFTDGHKLGIRAGDVVNHIRLTTAGVPAALHILLVSSVSTNGASPTLISASST
jgi:hypothetical protein